MGTLEEHGFDKCKPPVCSEDIDITVASIICTEDQVLHIEWTVTDKYGRDVESNIIQWSCENRNFDNTADPENITQPYKTSFDISSCVGVVYFRVKIRIETSFFYGDEEVTNNSECLSSSTTAVRASWCGDCADTVTTPPSYMLYARTSTVPSYPVYFSYDGLCWYIDDNDTEMLIADLSEGSILIDVDLYYESCLNCCDRLACPSEWVELPESAQSFEGEREGSFYFEYQTYNIPDRLFIVKNFSSSDCDPEDPHKLPDSEDILFDTGCVSTNLEDTPLFFVSDPMCSEMSNSKTYGFCVDVKESDLPLGAVIDCNCAGDDNTRWQLCIADSDGNHTFFEGGNECLCEDIDVVFPTVVGTKWILSAAQHASQDYIYTLLEHEGVLYGGTSFDGMLFKWEPGDSGWTTVAASGVTSIVLALAELDGVIYGSGYGGLLLKWEPGDTVWTTVVGIHDLQNRNESLISYDGALYCGTGQNTGGLGKLFKWEPGDSVWTTVAEQLNSQRRIPSLVEMDGVIYGGTWDDGKLFKHTPGISGWTEVADTYDSQGTIPSLAKLDGVIYGGSGNGGKLLKWAPGDIGWTEVADTHESQTGILSLLELNGVIYGGTSQDGMLFKWEPGDSGWTRVADTLNTQDRIYSLEVLNGRIYGGTYDRGQLFVWGTV